MIRFKTNNITSSSLLGQPLAKSLDGGTLALARGGMQFQADRSCLQSPHLHSGQRPFKNPKTCSFRFCQTHLGSSMLGFQPWKTWIDSLSQQKSGLASPSLWNRFWATNRRFWVHMVLPKIAWISTYSTNNKNCYFVFWPPITHQNKLLLLCACVLCNK